MLKISATVIAPAAQQWLRQTTKAAVYHSFRRSCNLANEQGAVLTLAAPALGAGPFAALVMLPHERPFTDFFARETAVSVSTNRLHTPTLQIGFSSARLWQPVPAWAQLNSLPRAWPQLAPLFATSLAPYAVGVSDLAAARWQQGVARLRAGLQRRSEDNVRAAVRLLAGLGDGLTPAGDDFLLGAIYGLWAVWPATAAMRWGTLIAAAARPLTTRLSAVWLQTAATGAAHQSWHRLVGCLREPRAQQRAALPAAIEAILTIGHTSGVDAMAGFTAVLHELLGEDQISRGDTT